MMVLVSYDVATKDPGGSRRLNRVAKACEDFGQRVQYSVFECIVDPAQWAVLKHRLIDEIDHGEGQPAFLLSWVELEATCRARGRESGHRSGRTADSMMPRTPS